jgi:3D (Asp-Asp-Asp) domain-containing protein
VPRSSVACLLAVVAGCVGDIGQSPGGDGSAADAHAGGDAAEDGGATPDGPLAADAAPSVDAGAHGDLLGDFQLTYYWVTAEDDYPGTPDTELYDSDCAVLATVTADFADALALEGTGRLSDGRVLNYWGSCGCPESPCFFEVDADHPWGVGVQNRALVPFRSIAVDSDLIAYGSRVFVAELDGVPMPGDPPWGDFVHDGCVSADDTGGAIVGAHIDFFAGLRACYYELDDLLGLGEVTLYDGGERCQHDW